MRTRTGTKASPDTVAERSGRIVTGADDTLQSAGRHCHATSRAAPSAAGGLAWRAGR